MKEIFEEKTSLDAKLQKEKDEKEKLELNLLKEKDEKIYMKENF